MAKRTHQNEQMEKQEALVVVLKQIEHTENDMELALSLNDHDMYATLLDSLRSLESTRESLKG